MPPNTKPSTEFVQSVKQALEHLYDFPYLQHCLLVQRLHPGTEPLSAPTLAEQLRRDLLAAIDALDPGIDIPFSDARGRIHNLLVLHYVEGRTIQETANELGLSERQTYRNLQDGNESIASILWAQRPVSDASERAIHLSSFETELGRLQTEVQPVDLTRMLDRAMTAVAPLAQEKGCRISIAPPSVPITVLTEPLVAQQVLVNVLSYCVRQSAPESALQLAFAGTDDETILILHFDSDSAVESSPIADRPVNAIAERLGWTLAQADAAGSLRSRIMVLMANHKPTILVIDDNEGLVALLERYLIDHACQVATATSGPEGLALAQQLLPSAIVLDVMMPEMDGWTVLQQIRSIPKLSDTPVLVCSVFDDPELAHSLGAEYFLAKPFTRNDLLSALSKVGAVKA